MTHDSWRGLLIGSAAALAVFASACQRIGSESVERRLGNLESSQARLLDETKAISAQLNELTALLRGSGGPRPTPPLPPTPLPMQDAPFKGNPKAQVGVLEYSDFQCPYCGAFARDTMSRINEAYTKPGKIVFAFRHIPIAAIHPNATVAAQTSICAWKQGRFWEMHDLLFRNQKNLAPANLKDYAAQLGLDGGLIGRCLETEGRAQVERDIASARALAINLTPTFFVGRMQPDGSLLATQRIEGAKDFAVFQTALDALLSSAK